MYVNNTFILSKAILDIKLKFCKYVIVRKIEKFGNMNL